LQMPNVAGAGNIEALEYYNNAYYMTGKFTDRLQLQSTLLIGDGAAQDAFVYKTDLNFNEIWVRQVHGTGVEVLSSSAVSSNGLYVGGYSQSANLTFESATPVSYPLTGSNNSEAIMAHYDFNGDLLNSHAFVSSGTDAIKYVSLFDNQAVFSGYFTNNFNVAGNTLHSGGAAIQDVMWIVTDNNLSPLYADQTTGAANDQAITAFIDGSQNLYLAGNYKSDPIYFNSLYGNDTLLHVATAGFSDAFLAKYKLCSEFDVRSTVVDATCPASTDGQVIPTVYVDQSPTAPIVAYNFTYTWSDGTTNDTLLNVGVGTYYVTLTSDKGCFYYDTATVNHLPVLQTTLADTATLNCAGGMLASAIVSASSGKAPYTYTWAATVDSSNDSAAFNLPVGRHYVTVTDACGTSVVDSIGVGHMPTMVSTINTHNAIVACPLGNDGEAWMNTSLGVLPYSYAWEGSTSTSYIASNLSLGMHHVTVTDACGVPVIDSVNVVSLPGMNSQISAHTDVTCTSLSDGTATIFTVGGVQPYTINWSSGETNTNLASNLAQGWAYVTVSDACGTLTDSVLIGIEPSLSINLSVTHESCSGGNGNAIVIASNGSGTYTYAWDTLPSAGAPISTNDTLFNLSENTYYVTVTDACGSQTGSVVVNNSAELIASLNAHNIILNCSTSNNGSASMLVSSGVPPYIYTWSRSSSTTYLASDLTPGIEYVTVTDACGQSFIDSVQIGYTPQLISYAEYMSDATCLSSNNGSASVISTGGVQPYSFAWSGSTSTSNIANDLSVGWHYVTVSDYCGDAVDSIYINSLPALSVDITGSTVNCASSTNGTATIIVNGGYAPYTYAWQGSASTLATANDLSAGWHYVTVTDGCTSIVDSVFIATMPAMTISLSGTPAQCISTANGAAQISVNNGVSPYTYVWEGSASTSATASDLLTGWHHVTVSDVCMSIVDSIFIDVIPALSYGLSSSPANCETTNDGRATISFSNGAAPFSFVWSGSTSTNYAVTDLATGWQYVTISDQCVNLVDSVFISYHTPMGISLNGIDANCPTSNDGQASVLVSGGVSPINFVWSGSSSTSATANDLSVGWQYVTVSDYCGTIIDSVEIGHAPLLTHTIAATPTNCALSTEGTATVIVSDGIAPYNYIWSDGQTTAIATNLGMGWMYVTISDACGSQTDSIEIVRLPSLVMSLTGSGVQCAIDSLGTITASVSLGQLPYHFNWGASSAQDTSYIDSLWVGMHYVTVSDACSDTLRDSIQISAPASTLSASLQNENYTVNCFNSTNGQNTVVAQGGLLPYQYLWSNGDTTTSVTNLETGYHFVSVIDACRDTVVDSAFVSYFPKAMIEVINQSPLCYNDSNGTITLNVSAGIQPYSWAWSHTTSVENSIDSLSAGWYFFTVTDQCASYNDSIELIMPDTITVVANITNESISGAADGSITLNLTGGTSPYAFHWNLGETSQDIQSLTEGQYAVQITDMNACTKTETFVVAAQTYLVEPFNAFSPNGDGVNDTWNIQNIEEYPNCTVKLFNQWGNLVFESTGYSKSWDGTSDGKEVDSAVYYYVIDLKNGKNPISGSITLMR